jgi:hypothetical protein
MNGHSNWYIKFTRHVYNFGCANDALACQPEPTPAQRGRGEEVNSRSSSCVARNLKPQQIIHSFLSIFYLFYFWFTIARPFDLCFPPTRFRKFAVVRTCRSAECFRVRPKKEILCVGCTYIPCSAPCIERPFFGSAWPGTKTGFAATLQITLQAEAVP